MGYRNAGLNELAAFSRGLARHPHSRAAARLAKAATFFRPDDQNAQQGYRQATGRQEARPRLTSCLGVHSRNGMTYQLGSHHQSPFNATIASACKTAIDLQFGRQLAQKKYASFGSLCER